MSGLIRVIHFGHVPIRLLDLVLVGILGYVKYLTWVKRLCGLWLWLWLRVSLLPLPVLMLIVFNVEVIVILVTAVGIVTIVITIII